MLVSMADDISDLLQWSLDCYDVEKCIYCDKPYTWDADFMGTYMECHSCSYIHPIICKNKLCEKEIVQGDPYYCESCKLVYCNICYDLHNDDLQICHLCQKSLCRKTFSERRCKICLLSTCKSCEKYNPTCFNRHPFNQNDYACNICNLCYQCGVCSRVFCESCSTCRKYCITCWTGLICKKHNIPRDIIRLMIQKLILNS